MIFARLAQRRLSSAPNSVRPPRRLKLALGTSLAAYAGYMAYNYYDAREREGQTQVAAYKLASYRFLPTNALTSLFAKLAEMPIPEAMRAPLYGSYAWMFGCRVDEAVKTNYVDYPTLGAFFARPVRPELRPIDGAAPLVSPADAQVLACGTIRWPEPGGEKKSLMLYPEQIKGVYYPLERLIGSEQYAQMQRAVRDQGHELHYCSLYLSPGVCHWIHSPAAWQIKSILRVPGEVLSVSPWLLRLAPSVFCLNERMIMLGQSSGLANLTMIPVGATNVRSVRLLPVLEQAQGAQRVKPGQPLGWFAMGSAVVLFFTAPAGRISWAVQPGEHVQIGQAMVKQNSKGWLWN